MPRTRPSALQSFLSSVVLSAVSVLLIPVSLAAVAACLALNRLRGSSEQVAQDAGAGCVIISGGRMSKGLTLARAFKRAGWRVIGVEEEGWGELCPMRYSRAVDNFYILPAAAQSYDRYRDALISIAQKEAATLFIPVSGAGSSVEDARAAETTAKATEGRCRTFIQDPETMLDLHEKDRFAALVEKLGMTIPSGQVVSSVNEGIQFLRGSEPRFILKCLALDENRGDMTLFPLAGDVDLSTTQRFLKSLAVPITADCPYVFQEFIPGQEWCTHASVIDGRLTSFVACPSNDMLMTYDNSTYDIVGRRAEQWTRDFLERLGKDRTPSGERRRLTGHFAFDFIVSTKDGQLYPLECNARVHTAIILLPVSKIASCYSSETASSTLRPDPDTAPRSWLYNDLLMRYLPLVAPRPFLKVLHPSLPACQLVDPRKLRPREDALRWRVDPTLVADDWLPFIVLWHVYWPSLLLQRWWAGKRWTRINVSTGRIFEA